MQARIGQLSFRTVVVAWLASGCGSGLGFGAGDPFPKKLSELDFENASDTQRYEPVWPLWSNGLLKERWVYIPKGEWIDTRKDDWEFPEGSALFKTFSAESLPIETRVMHRTRKGWDFATYVWDGDDAALQGDWDNVEVDWVDGLEHTVPTNIDCRTCHEPGGGVIGLRDLQIDSAGARVLSELAEPPPKPAEVEGPDALTTEILGYFIGNCVHCHDGESGDQHSFDLGPEVALANVIDQPTEANATAPGIRVVPGDPAASILFLAISGEHDDPEIREMPPLGVQMRDMEAIERVRSWIEGL